ncbi:alpha/beta fold hydrolase [Streptomyces sp. BI20]|uniref:alpha/beta fold hydrolase n=1 Tax=Streptomyces sp. BI20 TaxID=3403460 RepID=UPI003C717CB3
MAENATRTVELSAGALEYVDTGGPGPVVVLVHGLLFDEAVWTEVVALLREDFRVLVPVLPLGAHRRPVRPVPGRPLSAHTVAGLLGEFLERLNLDDVTLVQNDVGIAQLLVGTAYEERIGRLVLTSCEALDNHPPGLQGRLLVEAARMPGGLFALLQGFRLPALARLPFALGGMTRRPLPDGLIRRWYRPVLTDPAVRADLRAFLRATEAHTYREAGERLRSFPRPVLVAWGALDRMMPPDTGRRLAALCPRGEFVTVPGARTLVPWDNPKALALAVRAFASRAD